MPWRIKTPRQVDPDGVMILARSLANPFVDLGHDFVLVDAPLLQSVAVADRYRAVVERLGIDRDAKRCTDFVLTTIASSDGAFLVVEDVESRLQVAVDLLRDLGHSVLLD